MIHYLLVIVGGSCIGWVAGNSAFKRQYLTAALALVGGFATLTAFMFPR